MGIPLILGLGVAKKVLEKGAKNIYKNIGTGTVAAPKRPLMVDIGVGGAAGAGVVLSKQKKEKERQAIARKKEAAKPRDRRGKRGTQSGVTAVKRDGAVIRGKTRAKYGGTL